MLSARSSITAWPSCRPIWTSGSVNTLHLSEHWFDRLAAQPIKGAAGFGPQLAVHALACRQVFGHSAARRWSLAQGGALLVVFLGGNQQRAVGRLGGGIGVRPVAGVGQHRAQRGVFADHCLGWRC